MKKKAALVKDKNGFWELYKPILEQHDYDVQLLNLFTDFDQKKMLESQWDVFIWRAKHNPKERNPAKRLIYFAESILKLKSYPDWKTFNLFDDKIAQHYFLYNKQIPCPETFVFYNKEDAIEFSETAQYPIIFKAATGAGSSNVGLLKNKRETQRHIKRAFGKGINTFFESDLQKDYVYFQKFLEGNQGDFRLVCFGERIDGFFRNNRKNKPFASGSYDFDLKELPEDLLNFVDGVNKKLGFDVMSYDLLKDGVNWVITEMSVVYGDLKDEVYNNCLKYKRTSSGTWQKFSSEENHHVSVFKHILNKWESND